ncbi:hypothetical protein M9Y10_000395 [Tritrichomonas musculus]|uniref:Uncharacterized protein n=1 Tax=Tritrichomonas musculus TaxID=1915356 RepID=A0ABR2L438_9EUKA
MSVISRIQTNSLNPIEYIFYTDIITNNEDILVQEKQNDILKDLLLNQYDAVKYDVELEYNNQFIKDVFTLVNKLPKLLQISQTKPIEPIFDEIEVLKTDSVEIKKFIRKVNYDMIGYNCNHNAINEKCDKVFINVNDLIESDEYKEYCNFIKRCMLEIYTNIKWYEHEKKTFTSKCNRWQYSNIEGVRRELSNIKSIIFKLNAKITEINSKTNKRCSRCEAKQRLYDYSLREIDRMRNEQQEQEEINRKYDETDYDIETFMKDNYPTIERFLLKDVQQKYHKVFGIKLTFAELTEKLESTKKWKITNVSRTLYVNKL